MVRNTCLLIALFSFAFASAAWADRPPLPKSDSVKASQIKAKPHHAPVSHQSVKASHAPKGPKMQPPSSKMPPKKGYHPKPQKPAHHDMKPKDMKHDNGKLFDRPHSEKNLGPKGSQKEPWMEHSKKPRP